MKLKTLLWLLLAFSVTNYLAWMIGCFIEIKSPLLWCFALTCIGSALFSVLGFILNDSNNLNKVI
jgi:hypothetical protein